MALRTLHGPLYRLRLGTTPFGHGGGSYVGQGHDASCAIGDVQVGISNVHGQPKVCETSNPTMRKVMTYGMMLLKHGPANIYNGPSLF